MLANETSVNVVVTGASGGIGLALTEWLVGIPEIKHIFAVARSASTSTRLSELAEPDRARVRPVAADVTTLEGRALLLGVVQEAVDRIDLVFNVAGLLHDAQRGIQPEKRLEDLTEAGLLETFRLNAMAPALLVRELLPLLGRSAFPVVANVSARVGSIADNHLGGWYAYRASKAAQNMLTKTMSIEWARRYRGRGAVLALHPGTTETALSEPFRKNVPAKKLFSPEFVAERFWTLAANATAEDNGAFLAWDGSVIPW